MGRFTQLGDAAMARIGAGFGLGPVQTWHPIVAGTVNSNFALTTATGRWFVRVNEGKTDGDVAWEARVLAALAAAGVPTPAPRSGPDGRAWLEDDGHLLSAFAWLPGRHLGADEVTPAHAARLGTALAELHQATDAIPPHQRRGSRYDMAGLGQRLDQIGAAVDRGARPELATVHAELAREHAWLLAQAEVRAAGRAGVIHGDLFRDNVLWADARAEAPTLVALLDFEQASAGSCVYDLAVAIGDWCWSGAAAPVLDPARMDALLTGYQHLRPLSPADHAALAVELRAASARFTITRLTDVYLPGIDNPDKDYRAFLIRLRHWQGQGAASAPG